MLCDAGVGTVDLITYKIESVNPLRLTEAVAGSGGACGSSFLDKRFEQHVESLVGPKGVVKLAKSKAWPLVCQTFERDEENVSNARRRRSPHRHELQANK